VKNKIVLIGNGGSILGQNKGRAINGYDKVVRFNNFKITGFESDVGTKTDIWFTCNCNRVKSQLSYDQVYFHSWEWDKSKVPCYATIKEHHPTIKTIKRKDCLELKDKLPTYPHMAFSTGLLAIHILLKQYDSLDLIGFDWHLDKFDHHYGDKEPRGSVHQPKLEYRYIKELSYKGKINFL
jgi:hypothetical protein